MRDQKLQVLGMGIVTDGYADVDELVRTANPSSVIKDLAAGAQSLNSSELEPYDQVTRLAIGAVHQAWTMARLQEMNGERIGLIFATNWGMIDSTMAYLESMLDAEGRYASPRHFSRSVYSSAASMIAIRYGIKGPCETLAFDENAARGRGGVEGALLQAWRFLAAKRCDRVVIVWANQTCEMAVDLVRRASEKLRQWECDRYVKDGLGQGAVVLIVGQDAGGMMELSLPLEHDFIVELPQRGQPFPMDAAVSMLEALLGG